MVLESKKVGLIIGRIAFLAGVLIGITQVPAREPKNGSGIEPFIKMRWPSNADLAPDGTLYFVYNPDGIYQLYKVGPGKTQDDAQKLTTFPDGIGGYELSDDGNWIAITASVGGSEQADLYLMDSVTAKLEPLFVDPKVVYQNPLWRRDSKAFAYRANDESSADFHVYLFDIETRAHKKVFAGKGHHDPADFNHKGTKLVVSKYNSASFSQLFEVDLESGDFREITPKAEEWS